MALYFDYAATTPCDPRVIETMVRVLKDVPGNPSSVTHHYGEEAAKVIERARGLVASLIGAELREIIFSSGATESNNLAIKGAALFSKFYGRPAGTRRRIITVATEHSCVLETVYALRKEGFEPFIVGVDEHGRVDKQALSIALKVPTALVSIAAVNNETGAVQDVLGIGRIAKQAGAVFHCDGAQAVGKIPLDVEDSKIDLLSISAHKIYGPKGVGALYVRRRPRIRLLPLFSGGGQERGLRPGTLSPFLVAGMGHACKLCTEEMTADAAQIQSVRRVFWQTLQRRIPSVMLNGSTVYNWPGIMNILLPPSCTGLKVMEAAKGLAFSLGSACQAASLHASHVLRAMGLGPGQAKRSIRLSFGRFTTLDEGIKAGNILADAIQKTADMSHR